MFQKENEGFDIHNLNHDFQALPSSGWGHLIIELDWQGFVGMGAVGDGVG